MTHFLSSGRVGELLDINNRQLTALYPHIPHLHIGRERRATRLFPEMYVHDLVEYIQKRQQHHVEERLSIIVRAFWVTDKAGQLAKDAHTELKTALASRNRHTPDELATILNVTSMTIGNWSKGTNKLFTPVRTSKSPIAVGRKDVPQSDFVYIQTVEIFRAIAWSMPRR